MNNNNHDKNENYEISFGEIFKVLKRGFWKMVICAVAFALAAFAVFNYFVPKKYTSSVKLYVETATSTSKDNPMGDYNYATALVNTYVQMLSTNNFYEKLAASLDGRYTASELSKTVTFKNGSDEDGVHTEVFSATVVAKSPTEAKVIADSVADTAPGVIAALKNNDTELKIVDNATIPTKPSSPNVMANTIIAAIAGFAIMLAFLFMRELLDNKIKYSPELTELNGLPILCAVPDFGGERFILKVPPELRNKAESEV